MIHSTEEILLPLLQYLKDGELHTLTSSVLHLRKSMKLTNDEINQFYTSRHSNVNGQDLTATKFYVRVSDAVHILRRAKFLRNFPGTKDKGIFFISNDGLNLLLNQNRSEITSKITSTYKKYGKTRKFTKN